MQSREQEPKREPKPRWKDKQEQQDFGASVLPEIVQWIQDNTTPDDIYHDDVLHDWAIDNGYIKERDQ